MNWKEEYLRLSEILEALRKNDLELAGQYKYKGEEEVLCEMDAAWLKLTDEEKGEINDLGQ